MKRFLFPFLGLLATGSIAAQQKEGKVTYLKSVKVQFTMSLQGGEPQTQTQTRTNKFELNFANNQMSWRQLEDDIQPESINSGGTNMVIRTIGASPDDMTFCDFSQARKVEQRDFMDKHFLISDSIQKGSWKLTGETKTILNHLCQKATAEQVTKRMNMSMDNGKMVRKEVEDTSLQVAWFTTDIPVPAGPESQGQLPGLILEMETNGGRTVYTALEIEEKAKLSAIKEPKKGKKVTRNEFTEEMRKMLDEMQRNNGGQIRFRGN